MAKGKGIVSLKDTVPDNEIIRNGEVRNEPNYMFPDGNFGITGKYRDYSLVTKRIAYRTGTKEDGDNFGKVIEYTVWEDYPCYVYKLSEVFREYANINNLTTFKTKKLMTSISELVEIENSTSELITQALIGFDTKMNKSQNETLELLDTKECLKNSIEEIKLMKNELIKKSDEVDRLIETIKAKSVYIINKDKPKKHRVPKEED